MLALRCMTQIHIQISALLLFSFDKIYFCLLDFYFLCVTTWKLVVVECCYLCRESNRGGSKKKQCRPSMVLGNDSASAYTNHDEFLAGRTWQSLCHVATTAVVVYFMVGRVCRAPALLPNFSSSRVTILGIVFVRRSFLSTTWTVLPSCRP